jgi:hypothetical protein
MGESGRPAFRADQVAGAFTAKTLAAAKAGVRITATPALLQHCGTACRALSG